MRTPIEYIVGVIAVSLIILCFFLAFSESFDKEMQFQDQVYKVSSTINKGGVR